MERSTQLTTPILYTHSVYKNKGGIYSGDTNDRDQKISDILNSTIIQSMIADASTEGVAVRSFKYIIQETGGKANVLITGNKMTGGVYLNLIDYADQLASEKGSTSSTALTASSSTSSDDTQKMLQQVNKVVSTAQELLTHLNRGTTAAASPTTVTSPLQTDTDTAEASVTDTYSNSDSDSDSSSGPEGCEEADYSTGDESSWFETQALTITAQLKKIKQLEVKLNAAQWAMQPLEDENARLIDLQRTELITLSDTQLNLDDARADQIKSDEKIFELEELLNEDKDRLDNTIREANHEIQSYVEVANAELEAQYDRIIQQGNRIKELEDEKTVLDMFTALAPSAEEQETIDTEEETPEGTEVEV
jgi:hypothetical protein